MLKRSGLRFAEFDGRDFEFLPDPEQPVGSALDSAVELDHEFPVWDQRSVPCCVSCAVTLCMETLDQKIPPATRLSPLFHYFAARPDPEVLGAMTVRQGLRTATGVGVCPLQAHDRTFDRAGAVDPPLPDAFDQAADRKLIFYDAARKKVEYYRVFDTDRVNQCRQALFERKPVLIAIYATPEYLALTSGNDVHPAPGPYVTANGHAAVLIGFDDAPRLFRVKDSRGAAFGDNGAWWLPYQLLAAPLVEEAWVVGRVNYD